MLLKWSPASSSINKPVLTETLEISELQSETLPQVLNCNMAYPMLNR